MKTITVRAEFSGLKDFTTNLPQTFERQGLVIHNSRNVIKKIDTDTGTYVVKHFKGMYLFNRLAYSFFRKSKAARSYLHSQILNEKGIATPPHVAWMDCYELGLLTRSYFISVYSTDRTLDQVIRYYDIHGPHHKTDLLRALAAFMFKLHRLGIFHKDLSLGNILVIQTPHGYDFSLVDLNRIKFGKLQFKEGLRNFATLRLSPGDLDRLIASYAALCDQPAEESIAIFRKFEQRKSFLRRLRRNIRRYTLTPVERLLYTHHN